jgi:hypothetical protein
MRQLVANNIKRLIKKQNINNKKKRTKHAERGHHEWHTIKSIKIKLSNNQLTVTKAIKVNTLVIKKEDDYDNKTVNFINNNHFTKLPNLENNNCTNPPPPPIYIYIYDPCALPLYLISPHFPLPLSPLHPSHNH